MTASARCRRTAVDPCGPQLSVPAGPTAGSKSATTRLHSRARRDRLPIACATVGAILPFTPLAEVLGFASLPLAFFLILLAMIAGYLVLAEAVKARFYNLQDRPRGPRTTRAARHHGQRRRRAARFAGHRPAHRGRLAFIERVGV
jgi:hypothetical protein